MLTHTNLSHTNAMAMLNAVRAELEARHLAAAVAVVDDHGELLAFMRTDGCPLTSITIAQNKALTAARERRDSQAVGTSSREGGWPLSNFGDIRFIGWGGGVPVIVGGRVIGGVGVSGLTEELDIELARLGAAAANA
ncbi:MAG TPA: heme-binding protein [Candidatus Limnocylindrales bacterium]|nr:heme-binding protein [Candidatus Limnocylindrales bacterium]